jgi:hypothetical protein
MKTIIIAVIVLLAATISHATTTVMDFDTGAGICNLQREFCHDPYTQNGYRLVNTAGHYDFFDGFPRSRFYLNVDTACLQGPCIPQDPISTVRIDRFGNLFSLVQFDVIDANFKSGTIKSSAGGLFGVNAEGIQSFTGPLWTNIAWIDFSSTDGNSGVDNFIFATPEPSAWWLILFGAALIALKRMMI